ncbi:MAG: hypothetical protein MUE85_19255 [Microscillaceae bacterium]|jgi:hypothetical protein|nr:hypothetical protein [Microscillaceae bacterium]
MVVRKKKKRNNWQNAYKYRCFVKVGNQEFVSYGYRFPIRNLKKFAEFLDQKFPDWRFFNVYDSRSGAQIASFTKYRRPTRAGV